MDNTNSQQIEEREEHLADVERLKLSLFVVAQMDFSKFIERGERAQSIAPLLDPTLYMKKGGDLAIDLQAARILQKTREAIRQLYKLPETEVFVAIGAPEYAEAKEAAR